MIKMSQSARAKLNSYCKSYLESYTGCTHKSSGWPYNPSGDMITVLLTRVHPIEQVDRHEHISHLPNEFNQNAVDKPIHAVQAHYLYKLD